MADSKTMTKGEKRYSKPAKIVNKTMQKSASEEISEMGSAAPEPSPMSGTDGIPINDRHAAERNEMLDRHSAEMKDMHTRHQKDHETMASRHLSELGGTNEKEEA